MKKTPKKVKKIPNYILVRLLKEKGYTYKQIGKTLNISDHSIAMYLHNPQTKAEGRIQ
jgi:DNA-binding CsgD family transcriptional regulator